MNGNISWYETIDSTNEAFKRIIRSGKILTSGDIIAARFQTHGKGQRENVWESEHGANLTFSFYYQPNNLKATDAFALNQVVSILIVDFLRSKDVGGVTIKWPNDIFVENKKVCGVLIENTLAKDEVIESIVGIGLNVNQQSFHTTSNSTSLSEVLQQQLVIEILLEEFQPYLQKIDLFLQRRNLIENRYHELLFGLNENRRFESGGEEFYGTIRGVANGGKLKVQLDNTYRYFEQKEVKFLFD